VYNAKKYSNPFHDVITEFDSVCVCLCVCLCVCVSRIIVTQYAANHWAFFTK
jgi:threonine aldolase